MNNINFFLNFPIEHNILLYNNGEQNNDDLILAIKKTLPNIIIIYNFYSDKELKSTIINKTKYSHYFYTHQEKNDLDSGIMILSDLPIIIYLDEIYPTKNKRIARKIIFSIEKYQFKIDMNQNLEYDGYNFFVKFVSNKTKKKIIHSSKKIKNRIILLSKQ